MINPAEGGDFHLAKTGDFGVAVDTRRRWARQSAVTILYPRVFVEFRRISREITDGQRSRCLAILRTDHPAFRPVEISARSIAVSILRTTRNPSPAQHCCYDAMTPHISSSRSITSSRCRAGVKGHWDLPRGGRGTCPVTVTSSAR